MAIYEFVCDAGHLVELRVPMAARDDPRACPAGAPEVPRHGGSRRAGRACGRPLVRRTVYAPAVRVVGGTTGARPSAGGSEPEPPGGIMKRRRVRPPAGMRLVSESARQESAGKVLFYPRGRTEADQRELERAGLA